MLHLQLGSLHDLKKSERCQPSWRKNIWKMLQPRQFFWKLLASVGFLPFDYNTKSKKVDEKKFLVDKTANDWCVTLQVIGAINRFSFVFYFDVMKVTDNYVYNHYQNNNNYLYHTHLKISEDLCKLLASYWCD